MNKGFTVWFTGLSGTGKTTLSKSLAKRLEQMGLGVEVLDGDVIRTHLSKGLGFSREDRDANIKRIAFVSKLLTRHGVIVITAAISPYRETRDYARKEIGNFVEVYTRCSMDVLVQRDTKGLYKKAMNGEVKNFTGVSDPYEEPLNPELVLNTHKEGIEKCTEDILIKLKELGYIEYGGSRAGESVYSPEEEKKIEERLANLGYM